MKKSILEIYALSVCFVTLVCFVIVLGIGIYDLIQISNPEFTLNPHEYERHRSNEAFRRSPRIEMRGVAPGVPIGATKPSEEELTRKREESYQAAIRLERRSGIQSLTIVGIVMVIDLCVFGVHWLVSNRTRATI